MPTKDQPSHPTLAAALAAAVAQAHAVEKDSRNEHHKYRYASSEAIIAEAQRVLGAVGLSFSAVRYALQPDQAGTGVPQMEAVYLLEHASGESRRYRSSTPVISDRGRPWDKALATAKTYDLGYVLRSLLLLPRVEEGTEVDRRDDRDWSPAPQQQPKRREKPKPKAAPAKEEAPALPPIEQMSLDDMRAERPSDPGGARKVAWNQLLELREAHGLPRQPKENVPRTTEQMDLAIADILSEMSDEQPEREPGEEG